MKILIFIPRQRKTTELQVFEVRSRFAGCLSFNRKFETHSFLMYNRQRSYNIMAISHKRPLTILEILLKNILTIDRHRRDASATLNIKIKEKDPKQREENFNRKTSSFFV